MLYHILYIASLFDVFIFFFFNDTATTEIYTLSLHDALPICPMLCHLTLSGLERATRAMALKDYRVVAFSFDPRDTAAKRRSEEHTSELQSQSNLVCRLLLDKKKLTI